MCRNDELEALLDSNNEIIVVNDFIVEGFKSVDPIGTFITNTAIIRNYPDQIHLSHDRGPLVRKEIEKSSPLSPEEIIDSEYTTTFRRWLTDSDEFQRELPLAKIEAKTRLEHQQLFVEEYMRTPSIELSKMLKNKEKRKEYSRNHDKLLHDIKDVTINVMGQFLTKSNINNQDCFSSSMSIIYANMYTLFWRISHWTLKNGPITTEKEKLANDGFDLKYILISTFFNDILTNEKWLKECREDCVSSLARGRE